MRRFRNKKYIFLVLLCVCFYVVQKFHNSKFDEYKERLVSMAAPVSSEYEALGYREYSGALHVHTKIGGHSEGSFEELVLGAQSGGLDFVGMTEHVSELIDVRDYTLDGKIGDVLFIAGTERRLDDGTKLLFLGEGSTRKSAFEPDLQPSDELDQPIVSVAYPRRYKGADDSFDAVEVLSLHTGMRETERGKLLWNLIFTNRSNRALMVAKSIPRPDRGFTFYDDKSVDRRVILFSGSDSHSNIGIHLFGDSTGQRFLELKLDPYESVLSIVRNQILVKANVELSKDSILNALRKGHAFTAMQVLGDTSGFHFTAGTSDGKYIIGDTVTTADAISLNSVSPLPATIILMKDGEEIVRASPGEPLNYETNEPGAYRVEVYRADENSDFNKAPWILTNPIYLKKPSS